MKKRKATRLSNAEESRSLRRALNEDLVRVAFLFYEMRLSNQEISKRLKMDKTRVHRLIRLAVKEGLVGLASTIHAEHRAIELELLRKFNKYGLMDVRVALAPDKDPNTVARAVHSLAAKHLESDTKDGDTIGMTCGRAVLGTVLNLGTSTNLLRRRLQLVPFNAYCHWLSGNAEGRIEMIDSSPVTLVALAKFGMEAVQENAAYFLPVIQSVREQESPESHYLQNPAVCAIKSKAEKANIVLCGVGALNKLTTTTNVRRLLEDAGLSFEEVQKLGWTAEINLQPFDETGMPFRSILEAQSRHLPDNLLQKVKKYYRLFYAFDIEILRKIARDPGRKVIAVAYGEGKAKAIGAAIRGNYLNTLITDEWTGKALLSLDLEKVGFTLTTPKTIKEKAPARVRGIVWQEGL